MAVRWRIAILLAVITTINYIDRSVFGVVAPMIREQFDIGDADYGLITSGFLLAYGIGQLISGPLIDRLSSQVASLETLLKALGHYTTAHTTTVLHHHGATMHLCQFLPLTATR